MKLTRALRARFVPTTDAVRVTDYGTVGDGIADDTAAVQAAVDAAGSGRTVRFPAGKYRLTSAVSWASGVTLLGDIGAELLIDGAHAALELPAGAVGNQAAGLTFVGTMPTNLVGRQSHRAQCGIDSLAATSSQPITRLVVERCTFLDIEGFAIRIKHPRWFSITSSRFHHYGYAGVGLYSAISGDITDNDLTGTNLTPQGTTLSYGIFLSLYEPDPDWGGPTTPESQNVTIARNRIRTQAWESIDVHSARQITFSENIITGGKGAGITATSNDPASPLAVDDLIVQGNVIEYPNLTESGGDESRGGIIIRGAQPGVTKRELANCVISGNTVRRMGLRDSIYSAGILIANLDGAVIQGNSLVECRSHGIVVQDSVGVTITGNVIQDVWRAGGNTSSAVYLSRHIGASVTATVVGNHMIRGKLKKSQIPSGSLINHAGVAGTASADVVAMESANMWPDGTGQTGSITRMTGGVRGSREVEGTGPPTSGEWRRSDTVRNTQPGNGSPVGWVCVTAGTPGTWRPYGVIY